MKAYAIKHKGQKTTYIALTPTSVSPFDLIPRLNSDCVMNKDQADRFLKKPGTDPRYERIELSITIIKPKKKPETDIELAIRHFNELPSQEKWDIYKKPHWKKLGTFQCPNCKTKQNPQRCSPFPGMTLHCSNCETILTRRTGGGQNDPFNFKLTPKIKFQTQNIRKT